MSRAVRFGSSRNPKRSLTGGWPGHSERSIRLAPTRWSWQERTSTRNGRASHWGTHDDLAYRVEHKGPHTCVAWGCLALRNPARRFALTTASAPTNIAFSWSSIGSSETRLMHNDVIGATSARNLPSWLTAKRPHFELLRIYIASPSSADCVGLVIRMRPFSEHR